MVGGMMAQTPYSPEGVSRHPRGLVAGVGRQGVESPTSTRVAQGLPEGEVIGPRSAPRPRPSADEIVTDVVGPEAAAVDGRQAHPAAREARRARARLTCNTRLGDLVVFVTFPRMSEQPPHSAFSTDQECPLFPFLPSFLTECRLVAMRGGSIGGPPTMASCRDQGPCNPPPDSRPE